METNHFSDSSIIRPSPGTKVVRYVVYFEHKRTLETLKISPFFIFFLFYSNQYGMNKHALILTISDEKKQYALIFIDMFLT